MNSDTLVGKFEYHPNIISRNIRGKTIVLNYKNSNIINLNNIASLIWDKLPTTRVSKIIDELTSKFRRPKDEIKNDTLAFLKSLEKNGFISEKDKVKSASKPISELVLREKIKSLGMRLRKPLIVETELLYQCNLKCIHCFNITERKKKGSLNTAPWKRIIDQLFDNGTIYLVFTGGEIFLRKDLFEIIEYADKKGFLIRLLTNGTLIGKEEVQKLQKFRITSIQISIYSHIPKIHDSVTQVKGSFEKSINAVKELRKNGVGVEVATPLMAVNFQKHQGIKQLAKKLGVRHRYSYPLFERYDGSKDIYALRLSKDQILKFFSENPEQIIYENRKQNELLCGAGVNQCLVSPFGDVFPCTLLHLKLGNLANQTLIDIWNSSKFLRNLRTLRIKNLAGCPKCPAISYCNICPGLNIKATGQILKPAKVCCDYAFPAKQVLEQINKKVKSND